MRRILILMGRYLPGHRDGGPLRTIANVTDALGDEYDFYIGCLDRDHGDEDPYPNIVKGSWNQVGKAKVWYVEPGGFTDDLILRLADGKDHIYLSSFYDDYGYKTLWLKRSGKIGAAVTLASMGVFAKDALDHKALKKKLFIAACKSLGLFRNITWSVTSEAEANDLKRTIGEDATYVVAEDLPRSAVPGRTQASYGGPLRVVFLSRICAHKGLDIAIDALKGIDDCVFTIYGPVQEQEYWDQCQEQLNNCNLSWGYEGDAPSEEVQSLLAKQDVLILPTKSENYGHVVFEALSVGCIPLITAGTIWDDVAAKRAGFVVSRSAGEFRSAIEKALLMEKDDRHLMAMNAIRYADEKRRESVSGSGYRKIFSA